MASSSDNYGFFLKRLRELKTDASTSPAQSFKAPPESTETAHLVAVLKPLSKDTPTAMVDLFRQSDLGDMRTFSKAMSRAVEYEFVDVEGSKREGERFYLTEMGRVFLEEQS